MSALEPEDIVIRLFEIVPGLLEISKINRQQVTAGMLEALYDSVVSMTPNQSESNTKPEDRMRITMEKTAQAIGLEWKHASPVDHPYGAELDGVLLRDGEQVAVVELEAIDAKHARAALLDLLTYPTGRKLLVIGRSKRATGSDNPASLCNNLRRNVLPAVGQALATNPDVGIFTELELRFNPDVLRQFLQQDNTPKPNGLRTKGVR
jgi:hypothetical protein